MRVLADRVIAKLVHHWGISNMDQTRGWCNWVFRELPHQENVSLSKNENFFCSCGWHLHSCRVSRLHSHALKACGCTLFLPTAPWIRACWQLSLPPSLKTVCVFQIYSHPLHLPFFFFLKISFIFLHSIFLNSELLINFPCRLHW